jgi:uncharacterized protein YndB with AHSA1/START domain
MSEKKPLKNKANEINIIRVYDAPVKVVWEAWTDPKQVAQWWGPRGFTITTHSKDLKVGGHWHYTMHGPDGVDYPNKTKYFEVDKYARLVYDHGGNDEQAPLFRVTVLFSEKKGKTTMDMTMSLPSPEAAKEAKKFIKKAGGNATWDRLAEYLSKTSSDKDIFVINRTFDTSVDTMFDMWTHPDHVSQWMGPAGSKTEFFRANIKPGGDTFYKMTGENNFSLFGKTNYLEIERPYRIVYTQQFCDENENIIRHPMAPVWPETMLTTVTFTEEGPHQTRVTVVWETDSRATEEEIAAFVKAKAGMTQGWTGSFDKLEDALKLS